MKSAFLRISLLLVLCLQLLVIESEARRKPSKRLSLHQWMRRYRLLPSFKVKPRAMFRHLKKPGGRVRGPKHRPEPATVNTFHWDGSYEEPHVSKHEELKNHINNFSHQLHVKVEVEKAKEAAKATASTPAYSHYPGGWNPWTPPYPPVPHYGYGPPPHLGYGFPPAWGYNPWAWFNPWSHFAYRPPAPRYRPTTSQTYNTLPGLFGYQGALAFLPGISTTVTYKAPPRSPPFYPSPSSSGHNSLSGHYATLSGGYSPPSESYSRPSTGYDVPITSYAAGIPSSNNGAPTSVTTYTSSAPLGLSGHSSYPVASTVTTYTSKSPIIASTHPVSYSPSSSVNSVSASTHESLTAGYSVGASPVDSVTHAVDYESTGGSANDFGASSDSYVSSAASSVTGAAVSPSVSITLPEVTSSDAFSGDFALPYSSGQSADVTTYSDNNADPYLGSYSEAKESVIKAAAESTSAADETIVERKNGSSKSGKNVTGGGAATIHCTSCHITFAKRKLPSDVKTSAALSA